MDSIATSIPAARETVFGLTGTPTQKHLTETILCRYEGGVYEGQRLHHLGAARRGYKFLPMQRQDIISLQRNDGWVYYLNGGKVTWAKFGAAASWVSSSYLDDGKQFIETLLGVGYDTLPVGTRESMLTESSLRDKCRFIVRAGCSQSRLDRLGLATHVIYDGTQADMLTVESFGATTWIVTPGQILTDDDGIFTFKQELETWLPGSRTMKLTPVSKDTRDLVEKMIPVLIEFGDPRW